MAIIAIEEVALFVTETTENSVENLEAMAFMDHSGIKYNIMRYNDTSVHQHVIDGVNQYWSGERALIQRPELDLTSFPFLLFVEVHDDIPARQSPYNYLTGITDIKTFPEIYSINEANV